MDLLSPLQEKPTSVSDDAPMTLEDCPVRTTLDVIRGKWKPLIMFFLKPGMRRYSELRTHLPDATEKVLIEQLRQLEQDGIIYRVVHQEVPPRVEYHVSPYGETLSRLLQEMADWGALHRSRKFAAPVPSTEKHRR